jgi:hypothetical protein
MAKKVDITAAPHNDDLDLMEQVLRPLATQLAADNQTRWHYEASFISKEGDRCTARITVERSE